ncbi:MAG: hypothetical protein FWJ90_07335 [Actinomadura sp.]
MGALQQAGVPIFADVGRGGGYTLDKNRTLPPLTSPPPRPSRSRSRWPARTAPRTPGPPAPPSTRSSRRCRGPTAPPPASSPDASGS